MLTKEQIESFKRDGALALRGFFSSAEVERWRAEIFTFFDEPRTAAQWRDALRTHRSNDFRCDPDPTPQAHHALSALYGALNRAMRWVGDNQLVIRAGDEDAPWLGARAPHLDFPVYAPLRTLANNVICLSEVRECGGAFMYWPGSHRVAWDYFREYPEDYLIRGCRSQDEIFGHIRARMTSPPLEFAGAPGDILIWHSLILHSASVNKRPEARLALFGRWGAALSGEPIYDFGGDMWAYWDFQPTDS